MKNKKKDKKVNEIIDKVITHVSGIRVNRDGVLKGAITDLKDILKTIKHHKKRDCSLHFSSVDELEYLQELIKKMDVLVCTGRIEIPETPICN